MNLLDNITIYLIVYFVSVGFLVYVYYKLFKDIETTQENIYHDILIKIDFLYKNSEKLVLYHLQNIKDESIKINQSQKDILKEMREFSAFLFESQKQIIQLNKQLDKRHELENEIIKLKRINTRLSKDKETI